MGVRHCAGYVHEVGGWAGSGCSLDGPVAVLGCWQSLPQSTLSWAGNTEKAGGEAGSGGCLPLCLGHDRGGVATLGAPWWYLTLPTAPRPNPKFN